ncbi:zincin, partial [Anaeromyces robustus]
MNKDVIPSVKNSLISERFQYSNIEKILNEDIQEVEVETTAVSDEVEEDIDFSNLKFNWSITAEQVYALKDRVIEYIKTIDNQVLATPDEECSFDTTVGLYGKMDNEIQVALRNIDFLQDVSPIKEIRDASTESSQEFDEFNLERWKNKKIFEKIEKARENHANGLFLPLKHEEDKKLLEDYYEAYRKSGLDLPEEDIKKLKEYQKKLNDATTEYNRALVEDTTTHIFTKSELEGVSEDFLEGCEKTVKDGEEAYVILMDYPSRDAIYEYAIKEETRKTMMEVYTKRFASNVDQLKEATNLRLKIANLFGYPTHSSYVLKDKMAQNQTNVLEFLEDLKVKLQPLAKKEIQTLLDLKKNITTELNQPYDGVLNKWDYSYYSRILLEKEYSINQEEIQEYFPIDEVTKEMFALYEEILSIKCIEVEDKNVWHPDVRHIDVYDKETNNYIGVIYLDLYPRDGKYNHYASFSLVCGYEKEDGSRVHSIGAMVCNFTKPTPSKPSLLIHDEVVTYFHELGHLIHQLLSETKWAEYNGLNVEQDFVEAPSQMLENWCWEPEILKRLSHHYKDVSKRLPDDLIERLIKTKTYHSGISNLYQILYGFIDMSIHSIKTINEIDDYNKLWDDLQREIVTIENVKDSYPLGNFNHLVGGYDAGYYGYLWSQSYSADMYFSEFK